jgi:hypothetical protein
MSRRAITLTAALLFAWGAFLSAIRYQAPAEGWRSFEGTWSAAGQRQTLPTESGRTASIVQLSGAVVLTSGDGLSRGFRSEVIAFDDGGVRSVGRWVWTDEHGDQIFGEVRAESVETGRRFAGTITGGSGRYTGVTGEYEFAWQYVVIAEDGAVQGRTAALKGRYRRGAIQP